MINDIIKTRNNIRYPLNRYYFLNLLLGILLFAISCTKDDDSQKDDQTDIYVAGYSSYNGFAAATLWKNGIATLLSDGSHEAQAHAVYTINNGVYTTTS